MPYRLFSLVLLCFGPVTSLAHDVMFEGYYRVRLEGEHVGYAVQRFDFDPKTKEFNSRQFVRVRIGGDLIQESTFGRANDRLEPLSYQYTYQRGQEVKKIDGSFKGREMRVAITEGDGPARIETSRTPERAILSSFLLYSIMQKKLRPRSGWKFDAVAEELGQTYPGVVRVVSERKALKRSDFKLEVGFKDETLKWDLVASGDEAHQQAFTRGEVFATESIEKGFQLDLVPKPEVATVNHAVPSRTLVTVFGNVPTGRRNMASGSTINL